MGGWTDKQTNMYFIYRSEAVTVRDFEDTVKPSFLSNTHTHTRSIYVPNVISNLVLFIIIIM